MTGQKITLTVMLTRFGFFSMMSSSQDTTWASILVKKKKKHGTWDIFETCTPFCGYYHEALCGFSCWIKRSQVWVTGQYFCSMWWCFVKWSLSIALKSERVFLEVKAACGATFRLWNNSFKPDSTCWFMCRNRSRSLKMVQDNIFLITKWGTGAGPAFSFV